MDAVLFRQRGEAVQTSKMDMGRAINATMNMNRPFAQDRKMLRDLLPH